MKPAPLRLASLVTAALVAACGSDASGTLSGRSVDGVLLVVCDTLRADRLSCYGYERRTKGIDGLARRGTLYANHHPQGHWTLPSMISLMTGLYVQTESQALPTDRPTLAEWLSESGVDTAAFVGNNVIGRERGFARGFDHFHMVEDPRTRAGVLVDEFLAWREERRARGNDDPWFCWIHLMDPHSPYTPLPQDAIYRDYLRRPDQDGLAPAWLAARDGVAATNAGRRTEYLADVAAMERMIRTSNAYDGEIRSVDRAVERLVERFESEGALARTAILFAADHGEMLYEYPHYPAKLAELVERNNGLPNGLADWFVSGHENWFYPEQWRTPMIAVGPGFAAGTRRTGLSANIDIYPTVLDLFSIERPPVLDGEHLERSSERTTVFGHGRGTTAVLRRDGVQIVELEAGRYFTDRTATLLFDTEVPRVVDLAGERSRDRDDLTAQLANWRATRAFAPNMDVPEITAHVLRQLGYAELEDEQPKDAVDADH